MKYYLSLFCVVVAIGAATAADNTTQCHACLKDSFSACQSDMSVKNCTNPETDSCFSAAGRYNFNNGSTAVLSGVARGCIPCPNTTAGCAEFKTWVNQEANWTLLDCNIQCCKGDKCNNFTVDLPTAAPTDMSSTSTVYVSTKTSNARPIHHFQSAVLFITAIVGVFFF